MYFQTSETLLEIEFMKCELMVQSLGKKKENYSKSVVEASILLKKHRVNLCTLEPPIFQFCSHPKFTFCFLIFTGMYEE